MSYTLKDVMAAAQRIKAACPDVRISNECDYGFRLAGYKHGDDKALILFQPLREDIGQEEIVSDAAAIDEAIRYWGGTP